MGHNSRRLGTIALVLALAVVGLPAFASGSSGSYVADRDTKIHIMGEWAHPDDDTSIIGPCGVWHDRYGVKCGVIMVTRGEGGGNAVGTELGPALGLRRENEDRIAHYRSGTVDIFNLDRIDFFYNQSAPLTQYFWDEEETLRRVTRVIRTTQPEIYIGFTPTLNAGHGNHQQAGRLIWEGVLAAADPSRFPEQLRGPGALSTWQVKKVFSGGNTAGTGGTTDAAHCTTGFVPAADNLDAVVGVWTGYPSPYRWPAGNLQGVAAGTPKSWSQVTSEGRAAYPTQSRVMFKGAAAPTCSRFGMTQSFVPFQPNVSPSGVANPLAGQDDAVLFGAVRADPGGLPKGTLEYLTFSRFDNVAGAPFEAVVHLRSGSGSLRPGKVALTVPAGWSVDGPKKVGEVSAKRETLVRFTVTPSASAAANANARISARYTTGSRSGYTDNVVRIVSPTEGRFQRWGNWAEYDAWLSSVAPQAARLGRSSAAQSVVVGGTVSVPVVVHNWSTVAQSGTVSLAVPAGFTADATSKPYASLAAGAETVVTFSLTNTDTALPATQTVAVPITTTYSAPAGSGSETLTLSIVPSTSIANASTAPVVDGVESPGEYTGPTLDIGRIWQNPGGCTGIDDCGVGGNTARVSWTDDALYFFVNVRDDYQSYAVTPEECIGHWQADSVEILLDPRGDSSARLKDTATTFKLGVFPYTNDPTNRNGNGNGANGPCWSRDADNHQGYSTGPLASTVSDAPNAPGVQVASTAQWVGSNSTTVPHAYAGGGYSIEVKIPLAVLPSAVDPARLGLNITPYDNDNTAAEGTTELRHIDASTRLAWSAFGSVQSDPYRWGLASLPGYTPPADRPVEPSPPNVSSPNLNGALSPQTIAQSARNDVPISGRVPVSPGSRVRVSSVRLGSSSLSFTLHGSRAGGTARTFLWAGSLGLGAIPVYLTSCSLAADLPPDYGLTPCAVTDGGIPVWSPDQSGHVVSSLSQPVRSGEKRVTVPLSPAQRAKLKADGWLLLSYETASDQVQAVAVRLAR